ncbi:MAG: ABC transporter permease, partial [Alphaproteobacteria bacterium]|nr:ABC transporter permease [Alphaproteobacteria bacterium]
GVGFLVYWQFAWDLHDKAPYLVPELFDPYFVSKPTEIFAQFLRLGCLQTPRGDWTFGVPGGFGACLAKSENNLWAATYFTLVNTLWGFAWGVSLGFALGLLLGRSDRLSEIFYPYITAFNSVPRIALAPIIILAFGIGDASKIVTAILVVVFLVFFNTFEGARSVDRDHINAARLLGASEWQVTRTVIMPSTMAWLFASLSPAVSFALIGVIVGEFIGAEHGIGRMIIEAEARGEAAGMMVAVFVLMIVGVILSMGVLRLQRWLLRWRPANQQQV